MADSRNLASMSEVQSVRERPANTFGTNDMDGMIHAVTEIISNSCDEAAEGHGRLITVTIEEDDTVTVEDDGRGLPMGWNEKENKYNWQMALCQLNASGKLDREQYNRAGGLNGIGLTATQYASEFMEATSWYDGVEHFVSFKKGVPQGNMVERPVDGSKTGTKIRFKLDREVFLGAEGHIPPTAFNDLIRRKTMLIDGLKVVINHFAFNKPIVVQFEHGIRDFINAVCSSKVAAESAYYEASVDGTDDPIKQPQTYTLGMRISFNFNRDGGMFEMYHNGMHMFEAGKNPTVEAVQKGFCMALTEYARDFGKLQKGESFVYKDIEPILVLIGETTCPGYRTFFKNQTKGAVNNKFIVTELQIFTKRSVMAWLTDNGKEAAKTIEMALSIKKARDIADKVSKKAIAKLTKKNTFTDHADGLYDCECTDPKKSEIYIVEGKSALTSITTARDAYFQACIALTGKPLNCVKNNDLSIMMNNKVVINLYRALQCGIERKSKYIKDLPPFDINNLRYDKIVIAADADIDGKHIVILVLAMFYVLSPSLLKNDKVFIAESPLYEIVYKDKSVFAYSDEERDKIKKELEEHGVKSGQYEIHRSKGLGENTPEMMNSTTMSPENRRLIGLNYPEDEDQQKMLAALFEAVMGKDIEARKQLIDEYFKLTANKVA